MLELKNISKFIDDRLIINNVNITFPSTGLIGIKGESGCGKTSLLYIMSMLDYDYMGTILYNGQEITDKQDFLLNHISYMMQNKDYISSLTIKENILLSSKIASRKYNMSQFKKIVHQLKIKDLLNHYPHMLSLGQLKRVSIAKSLLKDSDILLCDEPTGALSSKQSHDVMKLLKDASKTRLVVIVSHDSFLLDEYCDSVLEMHDGKIIGNISMHNEMLNNDLKKKKHSLLFYPFRQLLYQKKKLIALCIFQWILITTFFIIVTSINGLTTSLSESEKNHPLSYTMTIENKDHEIFKSTIKNSRYNYHLSLLQIEQCDSAIISFLPQDLSHILLESGHKPLLSNEVLVSVSTNLKVGDRIDIKYGDYYISCAVSGILEKQLFQTQEIYIPYELSKKIPILKDEYSLIYETKDIRNQYNQFSKDYIVYSEIIERVDNYQSILKLALFVGYFFVFVSMFISLMMIMIVLSILYYERRHDIAYLMTLGLNVRQIQILSMVESLLLALFIMLIAIILSMSLYYFINNVYMIKDIMMFELIMQPIIFHKYDLLIFIVFIYILIMIVSSFRPIKQITQLNILELLREE